MTPLGYAISGAIVLGFSTIGLFFLRFWRDSKDRLFAYFALAFWILALERVALLYFGAQQEASPVIYTARLLAFALIAFGILDKNRK